MNKLKNKTVFIIGGLTDISKACAIAASREGANVVLADLMDDNSVKIMNEIIKENPKAMFIECNVSVLSDIKDAIDLVVSIFGTLDVALNNTSIGLDIIKIKNSEEHLLSNFVDENINTVFNGMEHELKQMMKQKNGVIVNLSSLAGNKEFTRLSHYTAAKHAIIDITQTAALEYATEGIRINAICSGFMETPLYSEQNTTNIAETNRNFEVLDATKSISKLDEIANDFIFFASADSWFISGSTLQAQNN